ncbi:MAG: hypothetical protein M1836_000604 [Candelina mexicana]|nr:MAG: hypothetical protein M1836_000604 [Candelina mexicana]
MAPRFYPWSKHGRRSSECLRTGSFTAVTPVGSFESEDMELQKKRPPPLKLIMPKDTKEPGHISPSSIVLHDSGLGSATYLASAANEAVAAFNKLLGSSTKEISAESEPKDTIVLSELPVSFIPLNYPSELPAELPGSLLMQNEGFSPDSLSKWGKGPEKFPRAVAISLASESPATPSRTSIQDQVESPDSLNAGSVSLKSISTSATEGNESTFKSSLPSSASLNPVLPAGVNETALERVEEGKTELQRVNQVLAHLIQAHEAQLRDKDDSIASLSSQVQTLQAAHECAVASLQNNHAAEIEFLRSLMNQFEKSKSPHQPSQHLQTTESEDTRNSVLNTSSLSVNARLNETEEKMANDVITHRISTGESGHIQDTEQELREQIQSLQIQKEELSSKMARLEMKVEDGQDELLYYQRYTGELHTTLGQKNDTILDLEVDLVDAKSELAQLREQTRAAPESQREVLADAPRSETKKWHNQDVSSAMLEKTVHVHELQRETSLKDDEIATLRRKLATSEDQINKLQDQINTEPTDITREAQTDTLRLNLSENEYQDIRSTMLTYECYISDLENTIKGKDREATTSRDELAARDDQVDKLQHEVRALQDQLRALPVNITQESQADSSRLDPTAEEYQDMKSTLLAYECYISDLEDREVTTSRDELTARDKLIKQLQHKIKKLQNQVINNPVDITLSYSAQASPNASLPSASSESSGISSIGHDTGRYSDRYSDPFKIRGPVRDPFAHIAELENEIRFLLNEIRLYKLDVRGYKRDVKAFENNIAFRDNKIKELKGKVAEYKDAFIGLQNAYAWSWGSNAPAPPPKDSFATPKQGPRQSSPVGLGINVLTPGHLRTRAKATQPPSSPLLSPSSSSDTLLSKFNRSTVTTPPSQTVAEFTHGSTPVTAIRKPRKNHTPKMPSITEQ